MEQQLNDEAVLGVGNRIQYRLGGRGKVQDRHNGLRPPKHPLPLHAKTAVDRAWNLMMQNTTDNGNGREKVRQSRSTRTVYYRPFMS